MAVCRNLRDFSGILLLSLLGQCVLCFPGHILDIDEENKCCDVSRYGIANVTAVCKQNLYLNCSLTDIPRDLPRHEITILRISDANFVNLKAEMLKDFDNLLDLDLSGFNQIVIIFQKAFTSTPQLEKLDLSHNFLTHVVGDCLNGPRDLRWLSLGHNQLVSISARAFQFAPSLQYLDLSSNQLSTISNDIFSGLRSLSSLNLANNNFPAIPDSTFVNLPGLRNLNLASSLDILDDFGSFPKINSTILTLGPGFEKLVSLETLDLSLGLQFDLTNTSFHTLRHSNLQTLSLSTNSISSISSDAFSKLHGLIQLDLHGCQKINSNLLRVGLEGLKTSKLQSLNLAGNSDLDSIDQQTFQALGGVPLENLDLSDAMVKHISDGAFQQLHRLTTLSLVSLNIEKLSVGTFIGLDELQNLDMSDNYNLRYFGMALQNLFKLRQLDISSNTKLDRIDPLSFRNCRKLQSLDLSGSNIKTLVSSTFAGLNNLVYLNLEENPLVQIEPSAFKGLTSLINLYMADHNLHVLPVDIFHQIPTLQHVVLDCATPLSKFDSTIFLPLKQALQYVSMSSCNIGNFLNQQNTLLGNFTKLQHVDFSDNIIVGDVNNMLEGCTSMVTMLFQENQITKLPAIVQKMKHLHNIDLSKNRIEQVNSEDVSVLKRLLSVSLSRNPYDCSCDLSEFIQWLNTTNHIEDSLDMYTCAQKINHTKERIKLRDYHTDYCGYLGETFPYWMVGVIVACILVLMLLITAIMCAKRYELQMWWYKRFSQVIRQPLPLMRGENHAYVLTSTHENDLRILKAMILGLQGSLDDDDDLDYFCETENDTSPIESHNPSPRLSNASEDQPLLINQHTQVDTHSGQTPSQSMITGYTRASKIKVKLRISHSITKRGQEIYVLESQRLMLMSKARHIIVLLGDHLLSDTLAMHACEDAFHNGRPVVVICVEEVDPLDLRLGQCPRLQERLRAGKLYEWTDRKAAQKFILLKLRRQLYRPSQPTAAAPAFRCLTCLQTVDHCWRPLLLGEDFVACSQCSVMYHVTCLEGKTHSSNLRGLGSARHGWLCKGCTPRARCAHCTHAVTYLPRHIKNNCFLDNIRCSVGQCEPRTWSHVDCLLKADDTVWSRDALSSWQCRECGTVNCSICGGQIYIMSGTSTRMRDATRCNHSTCSSWAHTQCIDTRRDHVIGWYCNRCTYAQPLDK